MKRMIAMLLALMLLTAPALAQAPEAARLEGPGWDTPEEAVLAYLDGMNRGDVGAMLATFAMETFVANADPLSQLERLGSIGPTLYNAIPLNGDYARTVVMSARYGQLATYLGQQYMELSAGLQGRMLSVRTSEERKAVLDSFENSPMNAWQGHVEFVRWISPAALGDVVCRPMNLRNLALQTEYTGADDIVELAAYVRLNGMDAVQLMQCGRYGDRWYNITYHGFVASVLALSPMFCGLICGADDETATVIRQAVNGVPNGDALVLLTCDAASSLAGSRWQLSALSDPLPVVADSAESALSADNGICGEAHFLQMGGGVITLTFGPALASTLGVDGDRAKISLAWMDMAGMLTVLDARCWNIEMDLSGVMMARDGDALTFTFPNGLRAEFRRAD